MAEERLPEYYRGDTWRFTVSPPTDPILGEIIDMTDRVIWFTAKPQDSDQADDSDATVQHSMPWAAMQELAGGDRLFVIPISKTDVVPAKYRADVQMVLPAAGGAEAEVDTLVVDRRFTVLPEVTRKIA